MSVSLTGSLARFTAIEVVTFLAETGKTGTLVIEAGGGFRITFRAGRIIGVLHESTGSDSNEPELVVRAMLQESGNFAVLHVPLETPRTVDLDPKPLIEQARERIEASQNFDPSAVFLLARDLESSEVFPADEVRILLEVNGRSSAEEIAKRCGLNEDEAKVLFGSLLRRGWLISREGSREAPRLHSEEDVAPGQAATPNRTGSAATDPQLSAGEKTTVDPKMSVARVACFTLDDTNSTSFALFEKVQTIGRGASNNIRLEDKSVSSSHARITSTEEGHLLEDLGSSNGTYVNGEMIDKVILRDKDRIRLGTVFMVYMVPTEVREPSPASGEKKGS